MTKKSRAYMAAACAVLSVPLMAWAYSFTSFDVPGATLTAGEGINAQGEVVGFYNDSSARQHGFLLRKGAFTTVDVPGAQDSAALGINSGGDIAGVYDLDGV